MFGLYTQTINNLSQPINHAVLSHWSNRIILQTMSIHSMLTLIANGSTLIPILLVCMAVRQCGCVSYECGRCALIYSLYIQRPFSTLRIKPCILTTNLLDCEYIAAPYSLAVEHNYAD